MLEIPRTLKILKDFLITHKVLLTLRKIQVMKFSYKICRARRFSKEEKKNLCKCANEELDSLCSDDEENSSIGEKSSYQRFLEL
jgi:hypothetical protein